MNTLVASGCLVLCALFCWWRALCVLEKAQREREDAEVEHSAAETYWILGRRARRDERDA